MDSKNKYRVISSFNLTNYGIIVQISDVESGFKKGMVLKSVSTGLYWEVKARIIHSSEEKRFDGETEIFSHINFREINDIKKQKGLYENAFEYNIISIGHNNKPNPDDFLVFHVTVAIRTIYKIIDIYDDYLLLDTENGNTGLLHKRYVSKNAQIGDYVRHSEHRFHDLVDEFGNFVYRNS
ncbi:S1 domain-containing protein [Chryseobacterium daecheongense]|uniref:Uncharacterized protein n=2 Tax=Chryseobacterium daecheongense TaxID=192389 RepID=A0A3N0W514_9FLAO|nr:S1-like domain-containing RNA-binding protein [Chryseobacterium daecheongense]ROI00113.1 hypothetical protein EGI05_04290 [Chryseobacterium daecheongense]